MTISQTLKNALEKKNVTAIRSALYVIAHEDPSLSTGKFYETLKYVKSQNIPGVMEPYDKEPFLPKDKWNEDYWAQIASSLMDNFCDERIKHLAEVGKAVYGNSIRMDPKSTTAPNPTKFQKIKASLISIFAKLVNGITSMVKKMKDGRVKKFLLNLLRKAQAGLSKSKSLQIAKPQMAKQLSDSAKEIQEKLNQMQKAQEGFTCDSFIGFCNDSMDPVTEGKKWGPGDHLLYEMIKFNRRNPIGRKRNVAACEKDMKALLNKCDGIDDYDEVIAICDKNINLAQRNLNGANRRNHSADRKMAEEMLKLHQKYRAIALAKRQSLE